MNLKLSKAPVTLIEPLTPGEVKAIITSIDKNSAAGIHRETHHYPRILLRCRQHLRPKSGCHRLPLDQRGRYRSLTALYYLKDNSARTTGVHAGIPTGHYFVLVKTLMRMWLLSNNGLHGTLEAVN